MKLIRYDIGRNKKAVLKYSCEHPDERIWVTYLRTHDGFLREGKGKIGKSYVVNGKLTRKNKDANDDRKILDLTLIPCITEDAAYSVEGLMQACLTARGHHVDGDGGTEWFYLGNTKEKQIAQFNKTLQEVIPNEKVTLDIFKPYFWGVEFADHLEKNWPSQKVYYLLAKARSGKNLQATFAILNFLKKTQGWVAGDTIYIHWLSLWPSTFNRYIDDRKKYQDFVDFNVVDTRKPEWEQEIQLGKINVLMSSMQSLGIQEETEDQDDFVPGKLKTLAKYPSKIRIVDENDHGMDTPHTNKILSYLSTEYILKMSGSDLYALANLTTPENSFIYDLLKEIEAIDRGDIKRPKIKTYVNVFLDHIFEKVPFELLADGTVSRRMNIIMETNYDTGKPKEINGLWCIQKAKEWVPIRFNNLGVVQKLFEHSYGINQNDGRITPRLKGLRHGYWTMPSVLSEYAFDNMIRECYPKERIRIGIANEFGSASDIEPKVNSWIESTENPLNLYYNWDTIFLAVGKMRRGATVPRWVYVMRMDDSIAWNINHQMDLRCQSGDNEFVYVFDWNPLRRMIATYDLAFKLAVNNKIAREDILRKTLTAQPIFLQSIDSWKQKELRYEELIKKVTANISVKTFSSEGILNQDTKIDLVRYLKLLENVNELKSTSEEIQEPEHEPGKSKGQILNPIGKKITLREHRCKEIDLLKAKCKTLISMLPILIYLNDGQDSSLDSILLNPDYVELWSEHVGIEWYIFEQMVEDNIFDKTYVNARIEMWATKVRNKEIDFDTIKSLVSRPSDFPTPRGLVHNALTSIKIKLGQKYIDPSCGDGEFIIRIQHDLIALGLSRDEANKYLYFADSSELNIEITKKRLGGNIDSNHYIHYNNNSDILNKWENEISKHMKDFFTLINPAWNQDILKSNYVIGRYAYTGIVRKTFEISYYIVAILPIGWINLKSLQQFRDEIYPYIDRVEFKKNKINGVKTFPIENPFFTILHLNKNKKDDKVLFINGSNSWYGEIKDEWIPIYKDEIHYRIINKMLDKQVRKLDKDKNAPFHIYDVMLRQEVTTEHFQKTHPIRKSDGKPSGDAWQLSFYEEKMRDLHLDFSKSKPGFLLYESTRTLSKQQNVWDMGYYDFIDDDYDSFFGFTQEEKDYNIENGTT